MAFTLLLHTFCILGTWEAAGNFYCGLFYLLCLSPCA